MTRRTLLALPFTTVVAAAQTYLTPVEKRETVGLTTSSPVCLPTLLYAIESVESGGRDSAEGRVGDRVVARGRYQITERVWFQHTNRPWTSAHNLYWSRIVAERHVRWLDKTLPRDRSTTDPLFPRAFALAWAWRAGVEGWVLRAVLYPPTHPSYSRFLDYSQRTLNLYVDRLSNRP